MNQLSYSQTNLFWSSETHTSWKDTNNQVSSELANSIFVMSVFLSQTIKLS